MEDNDKHVQNYNNDYLLNTTHLDTENNDNNHSSHLVRVTNTNNNTNNNGKYLEPASTIGSAELGVSPPGSSIPSPMASLRNSFNTGRRYKRPHSSSPLNNYEQGCGFDLNTIIRLSPNCLLVSPPQPQSSSIGGSNSNNSLMVTPTGSYGHYLPRPESNNNNIQRSNLNFASLVSESEMKVEGYTSQAMNNESVAPNNRTNEMNMFYKLENFEMVSSSSNAVTGSTAIYDDSTAVPLIKYANHGVSSSDRLSSSMVYPVSEQLDEGYNSSQISNENISRVSSSTEFYNLSNQSNQIITTISNNLILSESPNALSEYSLRSPPDEDVPLCCMSTDDNDVSTTSVLSEISSSRYTIDQSVISDLQSPTDEEGQCADDDNDSVTKVCKWVDCNAVFGDRASLSRHIGKKQILFRLI